MTSAILRPDANAGDVDHVAPAERVERVGRAHVIVPPGSYGGLSDAQLLARRRGIGASEVPAILGLDRYRTPLAIWLDKRGLAEPWNGNAHTAWGTRLEPVVADAYLEQLIAGGLAAWARNVGTLADPDHPIALATPDRLIETVDGGAWGLEVKVRGQWQAHEWGEPGTDDVPDTVAVQCQWSMLVTGIARWDVAVLLGTSDFRTYTLARDTELGALMLASVTDWWREHIEGGAQPPLAGAEGAAYVRQRFPRHDDAVVAADVETGAALERLALVRRELDTLEREELDLKTRIQAAIGAHAGITGDNGHRATWKLTKGSHVTDWPAVAREAGATPAMVVAHTTEKPGSRRFLFTPSRSA